MKLGVNAAVFQQISMASAFNNDPILNHDDFISLLDSRQIERYCYLNTQDAQFLEDVIHRLGLSLRAWHKILRVARTLADMAQEADIQRQHLAEALGYRAMDRLLRRLQTP